MRFLIHYLQNVCLLKLYPTSLVRIERFGKFYGSALRIHETGKDIPRDELDSVRRSRVRYTPSRVLRLIRILIVRSRSSSLAPPKTDLTQCSRYTKCYEYEYCFRWGIRYCRHATCEGQHCWDVTRTDTAKAGSVAGFIVMFFDFYGDRITLLIAVISLLALVSSAATNHGFSIRYTLHLSCVQAERPTPSMSWC